MVEEIKKTLEEMANVRGFELTENADKIIKAKLRFFGEDNWQKCCCIRDDEHFCMSIACEKDVRKNGRCDCNLFKLKKE